MSDSQAHAEASSEEGHRVLITGGAGFIGSHLAEAYLRAGADVYAIDNLSTGSQANIAHLPAEFGDRFSFVRGSILEEDKMLELTGICDTVIHLAAAVGVQYILDNPLTSIHTNIMGTEMVLKLCGKFKKRVLIASTSEVYGIQSKAPLFETDPVTFGPSHKARWSYAVAKLMDEFAALAYHRMRRLPVVIVRFFNTIGPRQTGEYGMVVPRFVGQALRGEPLTVFGDGSQTRTFTDVSEVCACVMALMRRPEACGEVFNIGGTEEVSMLELARRVIAFAQSRSEIALIPYDKAYSGEFEDMPRRVPSTDKLRRLIGFAPDKRLDDILPSIIAYHRRRAPDRPPPSQGQAAEGAGHSQHGRLP